MAALTGDNGCGLPSSAFLRSLGPPQRPDLIPPWQDPAERRTTITLFKNQPAGGSAQPSPVQPAAGHVGTIAADLDRPSAIKLDVSSAAAPAPIGSTASAESANPTIQASDPPSTPTDSTTVPSGEPTSAPNGGRGGTPMTDGLVKGSDSEENVGTAPRPAAEAGTVAGLGARAAIPATVIAADGLWATPSFLPALPSAEAILAGLTAVVGSPVTIGAAVIGGILFPTRTAADDTLDGTPFAAVPPPPNVLPGGPPVGLPVLPPLAVPTQADRGPVILPGGGPVPLPPSPPFPASQDAQGPLIFPGNPSPVQLPTIVHNEAVDVTNTGVSNPGNGGFASEAQFLDHFARHGNDFGAMTSDEYAQRADKFLNRAASAGTLETVRPNGDIVRYDPTTDEFGIVKSDGTIRTYYKPDPPIHGYQTNLDYFNAQ
jgi:hypothetical protein